MMTKEQIEALKPCPFCGESFVYVVAGQLECHQCGARGPQALREHQRQAWNRRAALAASPALIREAEARGMERAAEMMRKPGDIWRTCTTTGGPSNDGQKWVHMSDFNELLRRADAIRTAAATHREGK